MLAALLANLSAIGVTTSIPNFSWFRPFDGGESFLILQIHGWMLLGMAACVAAVLALRMPTAVPGVVGVGLGSPVFFGSLAVLSSARVFQTSSKDVKFHYQVWNLRSFPALVALLLSTFCFVMCEVWRETAQGPTLLLAGCGTMIASSLYTHLVTSSDLPGYKSWQPFRGGAEFVLLQGESWMMFGLVLNFGLVAGREETLAEVFPGLVLIAGLLQFSANMLLIVSLSLFRCGAPGSNRVWPTSSGWASRVAWICGFVLAVVPPALLSVLHFFGLRGVSDSLGLTPSRLLFVMFLSAPLSHFSGLLGRGDGCNSYKLFQPFQGGFEFVFTQSFGWLLYGVSVLLFVVGCLQKWSVSDMTGLLPALFFAQVCISASMTYFNPENIMDRTPDTSPAASPRRAPRQAAASAANASGQTHWSSDVSWVLCGALISVPSAVIYVTEWWQTAEGVGWLLLAVLLLVTLAGFHMVWTHLWLLGSAAVLLTGNDALLGVAAMTGLNICGMWYVSLWLKRDLEVPHLAMFGWSHWICEDLIGGLASWQGNVSWDPVNSLMTGFFLTDLGVHLLPAMLLLQKAAPHVTFKSVACGYILARLWCLAITVHHFAVDWPLLRHSLKLRLTRMSQHPNAFVDTGVINLIYGLMPSAPTPFFHHCLAVEAVFAAVCAAVTLLPLSAELRTWIFRVLGGAPLVSQEALVVASCGFMVLGALTIAVGAVIAYSTRETSVREAQHLAEKCE